MEATWDLMKNENAISEDTRVKVRVGTAWVVLSTIVATTVWLTAVMLRVEATNREEHVKMLTGITSLNEKSEGWVTREQLEGVLVYVINQAHKGMTNITIREYELREGIHRTLKSPKDNP